MANKILIKSSGGAGETPTTSECTVAEICVNKSDTKLFLGTGAGDAGTTSTTVHWIGAEIKDEDDMASDSSDSLATQQSIKAYVDETRMVVLTGGFNYGYSVWTKVWIPLAGDSTLDVAGTSTSGYPEYVNFIAPYDGTLQKVILRSEEACRTTLVAFHLGSDGDEMPNTLSTSSVEVEMSTDDTTYEFDFSGETNAFTKGQIIGISVTPESDMNDVAYTVVFQMDSTT